MIDITEAYRDMRAAESRESTAVKMLAKDEITRLNRDGANLQDNKFYAQFFLINDKPNVAADPLPFQIAPESLQKIAKTAIGRPFVLGASGSKHMRGPLGQFSKAEEIIEYQKHFAAGEIVHSYVNPETRNANVIVEVFPEYVDDVKTGRIPPYVSPLVENNRLGIELKDGHIVVRDARILHLQAVDKPGYGEVAKIHGTCEGMLNDCMSELRTLGASGKLKVSQRRSSHQTMILGASGLDDLEASLNEIEESDFSSDETVNHFAVFESITDERKEARGRRSR